MNLRTDALRPTPRRLFGVGAVVVLVVAMALDTTYLDAEGAGAVAAPTFSPTAFAEEEFPRVAGDIRDAAVPLPELAEALEDDTASAGEQFGLDLGAGRFVFSVEASGSVASVDDEYIELAVPELPDALVRIPLGRALSGTPVRDATGTISFGDFPDQTAYQSVAAEFTRLMRETVLGPLEMSALAGEDLLLRGAYISGGPPDAFLIQPVEIEVIP